jgi:hypothetical protein
MTITYPIIEIYTTDKVLSFSGAEITSANLVEEINAISIELPISTLEFKILNYSDSFSMFEDEYSQILTKRLPVLAYESVDGEKRLLGKFYLATWENVSEHEFEFTAVNIIGVLEDTDYPGSFWEDPTPLSTVLALTLDPINISYTLDEAIEDVEINGWIPSGNYRQALQQILFAAGAIAITARSETLDIVPVRLPVGDR